MVFALLALEDLGEPVASQAVAVITVTVLLSVIAHGATADPLARRFGPRLAETAADDRLWSGVPRDLTVLHWHGDVFDLPAGAVNLASSELTAHQAFRYGDSAYGLLFHLEMTEDMVAEMAAAV